MSVLRIVIVPLAGEASTWPSASLLGVITVFAEIAPGMSSSPAPCLAVESANDVYVNATGSALFCRAIRTSSGDAPG